MIRNYIKTAWRNLLRNKSYAVINIAGLAIGIAACLLIFLVIEYESSFDNFHQKRDHIYRIVTKTKSAEGLRYSGGVPLPTAEGLRIDFPNLLVTSLFNSSAQISVLNGNAQTVKKFEEDKTYFTDPQFFNVFNFPWLAGNKKTALSAPNTVVLTQAIAEKYFGNWHDALGSTLKYQNKNILKVTGVLKNMPPNTDLNIQVVISNATIAYTDYKYNLKDWVSTFGDHNVFVVLPPNMTQSQFDQNLVAFTKKHKPAEYVKEGFATQPLAEMHYDDRFGLFSGHAFSKDLIKALSLIGLFLLIIACVNFINLATAQAVNRSKEVGIRKVLGSSRKQLVLQFISETLIITVLSVVLAIGISQVALPFLNQLLETQLSTAFLADPVVIAFLLTVTITATLLSGFYPAMVLSGFNPITALKNKIASGKASGLSLRRVLVVLQFCIAQVLVIGTLVIINQMNYFRNKSLGFDKDAIITVNIPDDSIGRLKLNALHDELLQQPAVKDVSFSFTSPSDNSNWGSDFRYNNSPKKSDFNANLKWADAEYFKLYGLKFVAGGPYTPGDTLHGWVVNETLLKKLGVRDPKDAIGKYINLWDDKKKTARICGVVKYFNVTSLHREIPAVLMASSKDFYQTINIKLGSGNLSATLASVERLWSSSFPDYVYSYQFLDDKIARFYKQDTQLSTLYKTFAGIAIFISCLGLYGLVSFMAVQRTKEVGIRKTLGASVSHIVYLFSREFTLLIIIAFAVSAPIGWFFMNKWLQAFTYRINIGTGIFVLAIVLSVAIAWIAVGYRAIKAALANPVNSLRSE